MTEQEDIANLTQRLAEHREAVKTAVSALSAYGAVSTNAPYINVKDDAFGAAGDNVADDTVAINNAVSSAAGTGGRICFPRGKYRTTSSILTPGGTYAGLVFEGEGGFPAQSGSSIIGNFNDWLFKNGWAETNFPNHAWINLGLQQNYQGDLGPDTNHTAGCINFGSGLGGYIQGCNIDIWTGIGVYAQVDCTEISNCNVTGHWTRYAPDAYPGAELSFPSVGIWTSGKVRGGKLTGCKYGAVFTDVGGMIENIMLDTCDIGLCIGSGPIDWERNPMENGPDQPMQKAGWWTTGKSMHVHNVSSESCMTAIYVGGAKKVLAEGIDIANYVTEPQGPTAAYGILIDNACDRSIFRGIDISGAFSKAGMGFGSRDYGDGRAAGTRFIGVNVNVTAGGGRNWAYRDEDFSARVMSADSTGQDPMVLEGCPWVDDAINVSQLPSSPSASWLQTVKDSIDPIWTGSASNAGKPVEGGGDNRTHVRWNGAAWVLA